jgi:hypothetical protein
VCAGGGLTTMVREGTGGLQLVAQRHVGRPHGGGGLAPQLHGATAPAVLLLAVRLVRGGHLVQALHVVQEQKLPPGEQVSEVPPSTQRGSVPVCIHHPLARRARSIDAGRGPVCVSYCVSLTVSPSPSRLLRLLVCLGEGVTLVGELAATGPCPPRWCGCSSCPRR